MSELMPAVALLFDDTELGEQLRGALHERGARIVHEGKIATFSKELQQRIGADVLVVNLDDSADDALDQLYEAIDSDYPRVVFNDAQASRALAGWDRARWARHLAAKVLAVSDVDPPRPQGAAAIDVPLAVAALPVVDTTAGGIAAAAPVSDAVRSERERVVAETPPAAAADDFVVDFESGEFSAGDVDEEGLLSRPTSAAESEDLAAELEALLASAEAAVDDADESAEPLGLVESTDLAVGAAAAEAPLPPWLADLDTTTSEGAFSTATESYADRIDRPHRVFPPPLPDVTTAAANAAEQIPASRFAKPPEVSSIPAVSELPELPVVQELPVVPAEWSLVDDAAVPPSAERSGAAAFGIEKLSAAEYLAPHAEQSAPSTEPFMNLELVSMEEAVAPQTVMHDHEMQLDDLAGALSRIVALGAVDSGVDSVCEFLAALPASTRLTFIYTQHHAGESVATIAERLAARSVLPVHLAAPGQRARAGEVWVMPTGQQLHVRRDGSVGAADDGADEASESSIDSAFTMAAHVFGRDVVGIVFVGQATDAVAGAQAIHDGGGQVWVEASSDEYVADMVSGIFAERLVSFSGTPRELAAHLIEVFP